MKNFNFKKALNYKILWFFLSITFFYLTGGDKPIEIAVWLTPVFMLRFTRDTKPYIGIIVLLPFVIMETLFTNKGMVPLPDRLFIIFTCIKSVIFLTPYLIDRILYKHIPKYARTLLFPSLVVVTEAFLMSKFSGGTWGNPAYGIDNINLLQFASIAGIWGVMFLIYWTAAFINEVYQSKFLIKKVTKLSIIYISMMIMIWGYGIVRLNMNSLKQHVIEVACVTPGENQRDEMYKIIGQVFASKRTGSVNLDEMKKLMDKRNNYLLSETKNVVQTGLDIISWPECAGIILESEEAEFKDRLLDIAAENKLCLSVGIFIIKNNCEELVKKNKPFGFNKLIFISFKDGVSFEYYKHNLAPGWEQKMTIPIKRTMPLISNDLGFITGAICYDMDFPKFINQTGKIRADLLIAPSNDWAQVKTIHSRMARMRAIENGVALLRPTASGISIITDSYGRILSQVDDIKSKGAPLVATIPVGSVFTVYPFVGDSMIWLCVIFLMVLSAHMIYRRIYSKM